MFDIRQSLFKICESIRDAYIRQAKGLLTLEQAKKNLHGVHYFSYIRKEGEPYGYVRQKDRDIYYAYTENPVMIVQILSHEMGHLLFDKEPTMEGRQIVYQKRGLFEVFYPNTDKEHSTGEYLAEGFIESFCTQIWQDSVFRKSLASLSIDCKDYVYKDYRLFNQYHFYEEYKVLYELTNIILQGCLWEANFREDMTVVKEKFHPFYTYYFFELYYQEACYYLEMLQKEEVQKSSLTFEMYYENYLRCKRMVCYHLKQIYNEYQEQYTNKVKKEILKDFELYLHNSHIMEDLPLSLRQKEQYLSITIDWEEEKMTLQDMPKIELHVHLDGSVRETTVQELLGTDKDIHKDVCVSATCQDLNMYLTKFSLPLEVMQTEENLKRIGEELALDLQADGVMYAEVRFAPFLHTKKGLSLDQVVASVLEGFKKVQNIEVHLLLCMMRGAKEEENEAVIEVATHYLHQGVVGIDLAGAEGLYPTRLYASLFQKAREKGLPFTIHAGEADGPSSIEDALSFGAKRIGHGIRCLEKPSLVDKIIQNKITLEICPTSNVQTQAVASYKEHPIRLLYDKKVPVTVHTDNRTVSQITLTEEYQKLHQVFGFTVQDFVQMNLYAIEACFLNTKEKEDLKERYLKACMLTNEVE